MGVQLILLECSPGALISCPNHPEELYLECTSAIGFSPGPLIEKDSTYRSLLGLVYYVNDFNLMYNIDLLSAVRVLRENRAFCSSS